MFLVVYFQQGVGLNFSRITTVEVRDPHAAIFISFTLFSKQFSGYVFAYLGFHTHVHMKKNIKTLKPGFYM